MSGAQAGPEGPAVITASECVRMIVIGEKEFMIKQMWAPHSRGLKIRTRLYGTKHPKKELAALDAFSAPNEVDLSSVAQRKADEIIKGRLGAARSRGDQPAAKKRGSDSGIACPVMAAIAADQQRQQPNQRATRTAARNPQPALPAADPEVSKQVFLLPPLSLPPPLPLLCVDLFRISPLAMIMSALFLSLVL